MYRYETGRGVSCAHLLLLLPNTAVPANGYGTGRVKLVEVALFVFMNIRPGTIQIYAEQAGSDCDNLHDVPAFRGGVVGRGKSCEKPDIKHGRLNRWYWFPKINGDYINYSCETNYLPRHWTRIDCTNTGWNPEPKCLRLCTYNDTLVENAQIMQPKSEYTEGEKVQFQCNNNFQTTDGTTYGERTCLSNGQFTPAKCSGKSCERPDIEHGSLYKWYWFPKNNGEYIYYSCETNYLPRHWTRIDCTNTGWNPQPKCFKNMQDSPTAKCTIHTEQK
ncbi:hypothetical protein GDO81_017936 [Engystomops pustulosus]|uniref:Sushi domain-containing protein n=1 Tax=Engystomops pustulosus TaxID=76066 RepID=A0AAV7A8B1_ENGPU|nr:hypothetical protein GDO81_017936 [Engystomops pustulosus]